MRGSKRKSESPLRKHREALSNADRELARQQAELRKALEELPARKEEEQRKRREAIRSAMPAPQRGRRAVSPSDLLDGRGVKLRVTATRRELAREKKQQQLQFLALLVLVVFVVILILNRL